MLCLLFWSNFFCIVCDFLSVSCVYPASPRDTLSLWIHIVLIFPLLLALSLRCPTCPIRHFILKLAWSSSAARHASVPFFIWLVVSLLVSLKSPTTIEDLLQSTLFFVFYSIPPQVMYENLFVLFYPSRGISCGTTIWGSIGHADSFESKYLSLSEV